MEVQDRGELEAREDPVAVVTYGIAPEAAVWIACLHGLNQSQLLARECLAGRLPRQPITWLLNDARRSGRRCSR